MRNTLSFLIKSKGVYGKSNLNNKIKGKHYCWKFIFLNQGEITLARHEYKPLPTRARNRCRAHRSKSSYHRTESAISQNPLGARTFHNTLDSGAGIQPEDQKKISSGFLWFFDQTVRNLWMCSSFFSSRSSFLCLWIKQAALVRRRVRRGKEGQNAFRLSVRQA